VASSLSHIEARRVRPLAAVSQGYLVFRRHMLSEMTEEQQAKIREAYDGTGFVAEGCYSLEIFGFYTDLGMAECEARLQGGSWLEVPVNCSLPDELGRHRPEGHPGSISDEWYQKTNPGMEQVSRQDVLILGEILSRCIKLAES
jgi:hypothetical protein